jgi:hypothetical protein
LAKAEKIILDKVIMLRSQRKPKPTFVATVLMKKQKRKKEENVSGCRKYGLYIHIKVKVQTI